MELMRRKLTESRLLLQKTECLLVGKFLTPWSDIPLESDGTYECFPAEFIVFLH